MIVAERKPLSELTEAIGEARKVLVAGCGTCVAVCMAGGEKEVASLATELRMAAQLQGAVLETVEVTPQRQCDAEFLTDIDELVEGQEAIVSMACGAGVQMLADRFAPLRIVPALNTSFIGVTREPGYWTEYCQACGDCMLDLTGGICPISRCSKSLLNGPCGGSVGGKCEIDPAVECAWQQIWDRLAAQGRTERLERILPPKDWRTARHGGPRRRVREEAPS